MAKHKLNPETGEVWEHPLTRSRYVIHSLTDDGWVRYATPGPSALCYPLWTEPTLDFIAKYTKAVQ